MQSGGLSVQGRPLGLQAVALTPWGGMQAQKQALKELVILPLQVAPALQRPPVFYPAAMAVMSSLAFSGKLCSNAAAGRLYSVYTAGLPCN